MLLDFPICKYGLKQETIAPFPIRASLSDTLVQAACKVLKTGNPWKKAEHGAIAAKLWQSGNILEPYDEQEGGSWDAVPMHPSRDNTVKVVPAREMGKRGKGGSLQSRQALVHSLVHIESWAIDLSWDIIARFGKKEHMPRAFFDDFVQIAADEGKHFSMLAERLEAIGSHYGALPGHEGLWDSASETADSLQARLAIEHCVHEARGLDVVPQTISRFRAGGDHLTANLLEETIYPEEITHCAAGVRWFSFLCERGLSDIAQKAETGQQSSATGESGDAKTYNGVNVNEYVVQEFHETVRKHFRGPLKPPFNEKARSDAGFGPEWYLPLASNEANGQKVK